VDERPQEKAKDGSVVDSPLQLSFKLTEGGHQMKESLKEVTDRLVDVMISEGKNRKQQTDESNERLLKELRYISTKYCEQLREANIRLEEQNRKLFDRIMQQMDCLIQQKTVGVENTNRSSHSNLTQQANDEKGQQSGSETEQIDRNTETQLQQLRFQVAYQSEMFRQMRHELEKRNETTNQLLVESRLEIDELKRQLDKKDEELTQHKALAASAAKRQREEAYGTEKSVESSSQKGTLFLEFSGLDRLLSEIF